MSEILWQRVAEKMNEHEHMAGVERAADRVRATGEIFTPTPLVVEMLSECDLAILGPGKSVLDPACGDGQFLCAAKWVKILHFGMAEAGALSEIYGVDIMRDNVDLCKLRLGGGTILMGDTLSPSRRLPGQTDAEWDQMCQLFAVEALVGVPTRKKRLRRSGRG